ncbi:MAG: DUF2336 domain-containing protein [Parvibaculum sp.]
MPTTSPKAVNSAARDMAFEMNDRELMLRRMSDLAVLPAGKFAPLERGLIDMVVASVLSRLDVTTRRRLAERVAQLPEGPAELLLALARDEIEVAGPVLRNNLNLQTNDLVQIVRDYPGQHQMAIAERKMLPAPVVDALVECADTEAICRMLANSAAEISNRTFEVLVRRSANEPPFQQLLLARSELNMRLAQMMFWWAPPETRREILIRFSVERRALHAALDGLLDVGVLAEKADDALKAILSLVKPPVVATRQQIARLIDQATRHERDAFMAEIAFIGGIRPETAFRIFNDLGGEPMAVFSKAIGMGRNDFSDLMTAVIGFRGVDQADKNWLDQLIATFDVISNDRADLVLHCWDWILSTEAQVPDSA